MKKNKMFCRALLISFLALAMLLPSCNDVVAPEGDDTTAADTTTSADTTVADTTTQANDTTTSSTPSTVTPEGNARLTVVTYNIQSQYLGVNYGYREKNVAKVISEIYADVYCLQECGEQWLNSNDASKQYDKLNETMKGYTLVTQTTGMTDEPDDFIYYNANTLTLIDGGWYQLMDKGEVVGGTKCKHPRYVSFAVFEHKDTSKQFLVLNTHLDNSGESVRSKQVDIMYDYIESSLAQYKSLPMILCGDMNSDAPGGNYDIGAAFKKMNNGTYFTYAKQRSGVTFVAKDKPKFKYNSGFAFTLINHAYRCEFPNNKTAEDVAQSRGFGGMDKRIIDSIFVSSDITPTKYSVIYRNFAKQEGYWKYASDHMPVVCEMYLALD